MTLPTKPPLPQECRWGDRCGDKGAPQGYFEKGVGERCDVGSRCEVELVGWQRLSALDSPCRLYVAFKVGVNYGDGFPPSPKKKRPKKRKAGLFYVFFKLD